MEAQAMDDRAHDTVTDLGRYGESLFGEPVLEVDDLVVRYGRTTVLDGLRLTVERGEVVALLGRNGAGKSSLVRCLLGQQKSRSGRCTLFGQEVWKHRVGLMARVGVVPEEPDAPPGMTARQLGRFDAALYRDWDADGYTARLARYGVPMTTPFRSLSRGQKAQVMLALALASRPELLILDDPTLGLDAVARRGVFEEVIGELADRGITVLLTSHDLAGVESIATRVALLVDGGIRVDQDLEELKESHRWLELDVEDGPLDDAALEELYAEANPLERRSRGRRKVLLTGSYDDELHSIFEAALGAERLDVAPASLEEIVVAYGATSDASAMAAASERSA